MWLQSIPHIPLIPQQFMFAKEITVFTLERNRPMMAVLVRDVGPT